jgi:hypothetical protein
MLADMFMVIFMILLLVGFSIGGAETVAMVDASFSIQNEAQAIAMSEGRYGGYTSYSQNQVDQYISQYDLAQSVNATEPQAVTVSAAGAPAQYGMDVTATITVPFKFQIGSSFMPPFTITLSGTGRSVSSFIDGVTPAATYVSP